MMTMTTYPTTPEKPVTRAEINRLTAIIEQLEAQIAGAREHASETVAEGCYHPDDDMTVELAIELVKKDRRIAGLEAAALRRRKNVARLHDLMDTDAVTIIRLRHEIDVQVARGDVAEAHGWHKQEASKRYAAVLASSEDD